MEGRKSTTTTDGDFNVPFSIMERTTRQKISKEIEDLSNIINQLDLTDTYRIFYPTTIAYTFFSSVHGTFSRADHRLGHKLSLNRFKKISYKV